MTAPDLVDHLISMNVVVTVNRDRLEIDAPAGVISTEQREAIVEHKAMIMEMLAGPPESSVRQRWVIRDCNRRLREAMAEYERTPGP